MAFLNSDPRVGDNFFIKNRAVGYDQLDEFGGMYFIPEKITVHVTERFETDDKYGKPSKFVTVEDIHRPKDKWTIKVGTLLHAAGILEQTDLEGRLGYFLPSEKQSVPEDYDVPSGGHIEALAKLQEQMIAEEDARLTAAATPGTVTLCKVLPAPYENVASVGAEIQVVMCRDGHVTIRTPGFPLPVIVKHEDLAASIAV